MKTAFFLFVIIGLSACTPPADPVNKPAYFDMKGYFEKEAQRLTAGKPSILKKVIVNGTTESKVVKIKDWKQELSIFTDADINKTSWNGSFKLQNTRLGSTYISNSKKIPVKSVSVERYNGVVSAIKIIVYTKNVLYTSNDTLTYVPDKYYRITKQQKIKWLAPRNYAVTAWFKS